MVNYDQKIGTLLKIRPEQVNATIELLDEGNTIPFIARYRKERTGTLDEEQIREISTLIERLRTLNERRKAVLESIETQGKLTDELKEKILAAETMTVLEDLYAPYRPKRKTRASKARERGLEPLAEMILGQAVNSEAPEKIASPFITEEVPDVEAALAGARDIIAEMISDHAEIRQVVRTKALSFGEIYSEKLEDAKDERGVYQDYYEFAFRADRLRPHQILAMNRAESEKVIRINLEVPERDWRLAIDNYFQANILSPLADELVMAVEDAANRLLLPAIERDVRRVLTEQAEAHAINVFSSNLRALLNQPPLVGYTVLAIDPGYRTGSKVAVVDPTGKVLQTGTIYPHPPQNKYEEAKKILSALIEKYDVNLISIGNGTASRETEQLAAELTKDNPKVRYLITSEAGASVYSASPLARKELPDLDVSIRGAVSIGRRVQDPLAELVKIDPKSIGVGMYQHDVNQRALADTLAGVVESVVNAVGVDVNTASPALLTYVSGIGPKLAETIVSHRDENGPFIERKDLLKVSGLGQKAFEQSAGFLRIRDGKNALDASAIHPESYSIAEQIMDMAGIDARMSIDEKKAAIKTLKDQKTVEQLAEELSSGIPTLVDIFEQLVRPGRDPREDLPAPILRTDVLSMSDLNEGMILKGTVRNVVDFGAFVDIGVKQDGLLHRSQIPAYAMLQVGDVIEVSILKIEAERGRIGLKWADK
jgi:uncharacterized protein